MNKEHIVAHTGLRGIAATVVVFLHMHYEDVIPQYLWEPFKSTITSWHPVDVFFMLSGFILGYVYINNPKKPNIQFKDFVIKRIARIIPLHYLTILAAGVMAIVASFYDLPNRGYYLSDLPPQIFMLHAFPYVGNGAWNGPSWSLSMEFLAYILIFPALLFATSKTKSLFSILTIAFACMIVWALSEHTTRGWPAVTRITCHFSLGYILYILTTFKNSIAHLAEKFTSLWLFSAVLWIFFHDTIKSDFISKILFQCSFALLILGTANNKDSLSKKVLGNKYTVWLGYISYSMYMIHNLLGKIIHVFVKKIPDNLYIQLLVVASTYTLLLIISYIAYRKFEIPCRNYITRVILHDKKLKN